MRARFVVFEDELVECGVVHYPAHPFACLGHGGYLEVGSLTREVLTVGGSSHGCVEPWRAVATGDDERSGDVLAQRFEHLNAQVLEVADDAKVGFRRGAQRVVDSPCLGS